MRKCCIVNCSSCELNHERHLFEISDARIEWINIIKKHQPLNEDRRLYVCDLHFNPEMITRHISKTILQKNAVPIFDLEDTHEHDKETHEDECENETEVIQMISNVSLSEEDETQLKTLPLGQYIRLMQVIPQEQKNQNTIKKMQKLIESKDAQLEELQRNQDNNNCINISHLSTEQKEVIDCLVNGIKNKSYSENVRKFSMTQQYYSTAAYRSLRLYFNKNLPGIRTLQMWYKTVDGSPGISNSALEILREKAAIYLAENGHPLHINIMSDEIGIKKDLCYCNETQSFVGFSTVINESEPNEDTSQLKLAKDALVFLAVGPNFKIPLAYEFLNGLEGHHRAALTLRVIAKAEATGARVMSLTTDALAANITTVEALGVKFDEGKTYFASPTYPEQRIYYIMDPPHMLKLIRKHFCLSKIYYQDQLIDWDLLKTLVERQSSENFNLCNKLTKNHMNWHQKPMNVRLAAETISKSTADTLEQLRIDGYTDFENSEATVEFLRYFNDAFDILNFGENRKEDGRYKQRLCADTANHILEFANKFKQYISQLELRQRTKRTPILVSSADKGFFGFYIDFISLQGIYEDFVLNGPLTEFYPFQFSQDHLETFFSLIRNRLGSNDNPNTIEFKSAFTKLLVCHPAMTSVDQNVITNATGILTVSSKNKTKPSLLSVREQELREQEFEIELELSYEHIMLEEIENMEPYEQHMCAYIALCIEDKFLQTIKQHKYKCTKCAEVLISPGDKINDDLLAMKTENKQPSASTLKIVIFANAVMKMYSVEHLQGNSFNAVWKTIRENVDTDDVYKNFDCSEHEEEVSTRYGHKEEFISQLIKTYMTMKSVKICKKIAVEERGELIRHRKKREYIAAGQ